MQSLKSFFGLSHRSSAKEICTTEDTSLSVLEARLRSAELETSKLRACTARQAAAAELPADDRTSRPEVGTVRSSLTCLLAYCRLDSDASFSPCVKVPGCRIR